MAKIALAGGGTGGHVYPALAIGDALRRRGHEVWYYGDEDRLEGRVAPGRGYTFRAVRAPQYPRGGVWPKIRFAWGLALSILACRRQLRRDGIDLVLGVGGYISAPPVLAAWTRGAGRVIHEANVVPGMANRLCARVAQGIMLTYETTRARLPTEGPVEVVGVPVSMAIQGGSRADAAERYGLDAGRQTVLFVGGSLGAARINELAVAIANEDARPFQVLHLCGRQYEAEVREQLGGDREGCALVGYEDQMALAYAMADLVVCRAGSSTLAELCAVGKASLLIPSPNVTENHQEANARGLESEGAAEVLVEEGWAIERSVELVARLAADEGHLKEMGGRARALARLEASENAASMVERVLRERGAS